MSYFHEWLKNLTEGARRISIEAIGGDKPLFSAESYETEGSYYFPEPIFNQLAETVSGAYRNVYSEMFPADKEMEGYKSFWSGASWQSAASSAHNPDLTNLQWARRQAHKTPISNLTAMGHYSVPEHLQNPETAAKILYPDANEITPEIVRNAGNAIQQMSNAFHAGQSALRTASNVRDVQNAMLRGLQPGINTMLANVARNAQVPEDAVPEALNQMAEGILNRFPHYVPSGPGAAQYFLWGARAGNVHEDRRENYATQGQAGEGMGESIVDAPTAYADRRVGPLHSYSDNYGNLYFPTMYSERGKISHRGKANQVYDNYIDAIRAGVKNVKPLAISSGEIQSAQKLAQGQPWGDEFIAELNYAQKFAIPRGDREVIGFHKQQQAMILGTPHIKGDRVYLHGLYTDTGKILDEYGSHAFVRPFVTQEHRQKGMRQAWFPLSQTELLQRAVGSPETPQARQLRGYLRASERGLPQRNDAVFYETPASSDALSHEALRMQLAKAVQMFPERLDTNGLGLVGITKSEAAAILGVSDLMPPELRDPDPDDFAAAVPDGVRKFVNRLARDLISPGDTGTPFMFTEHLEDIARTAAMEERENNVYDDVEKPDHEEMLQVANREGISVKDAYRKWYAKQRYDNEIPDYYRSASTSAGRQHIAEIIGEGTAAVLSRSAGEVDPVQAERARGILMNKTTGAVSRAQERYLLSPLMKPNFISGLKSVSANQRKQKEIARQSRRIVGWGANQVFDSKGNLIFTGSALSAKEKARSTPGSRVKRYASFDMTTLEEREKKQAAIDAALAELDTDTAGMIPPDDPLANTPAFEEAPLPYESAAPPGEPPSDDPPTTTATPDPEEPKKKPKKFWEETPPGPPKWTEKLRAKADASRRLIEHKYPQFVQKYLGKGKFGLGEEWNQFREENPHFQTYWNDILAEKSAANAAGIPSLWREWVDNGPGWQGPRNQREARQGHRSATPVARSTKEPELSMPEPGRRQRYDIEMPERAMSEERAFRDNPEGTGVAYTDDAHRMSYIRAPKGGTWWDRYDDPADVNRTRLGAAAHETGHQIWSKISHQKNWGEIVNRIPMSERLTKNWSSTPKAGWYAEEFAQAYALMASGGAEELEGFNVQYARFMQENKSIAGAEKRPVPVVEFTENGPEAFIVSDAQRKPDTAKTRAKRELVSVDIPGDVSEENASEPKSPRRRNKSKNEGITYSDDHFNAIPNEDDPFGPADGGNPSALPGTPKPKHLARKPVHMYLRGETLADKDNGFEIGLERLKAIANDDTSNQWENFTKTREEFVEQVGYYDQLYTKKQSGEISKGQFNVAVLGYTGAAKSEEFIQEVTAKAAAVQTQEFYADPSRVREAQSSAIQGGRSMIDPGQLEHFKLSSMLGKPKALRRADPGSGGIVGRATSVEFEHLSETNTARGVSIASSSFDEATSGNLPIDPRSFANTIQKRVNDAITKHVNSFVEEMQKSGMSDTEAKDTGQRVHKVAKELADEAVRSTVNAVGANTITGGDPLRAETSGAIHARSVTAKTAEELQAYASTRPELAAQIQEHYGGDYQKAHAGQTMVSAGDDGMPPVQYGNNGRWGGGSGGGNNRMANAIGGMWNSPLGKALYGAYIAKRFWGWTMQPVMEGSQRYGEYMGQMASMLPNEDLRSSDVGFSTRQQLTQQYYDRTANQQFGFFQDAGYYMTGGGDALGRTVAGVKLAAGAVGGGFAAMQAGAFLPAMFPQVFTAGAGAAGGLTTIGAPAIGAGLGVLGVTALMEGYNTIAKPSVPLTFSRVFAANWRSLLQTKQHVAQHTARLTGEDYENPLTEREQAFLNYEGPSDEARRIEKLSGVIHETTGEDLKSIQPTLRDIYRSMGLSEETDQYIKGLSKTAHDESLTLNELWAQGSGIAAQFGYVPGTAQYGNFMQSWQGNLGMQGRYEVGVQASQAARYGGMLGGYFSDPNMANQLVANSNITTQPEAQVVQTMLDALSNYELKGEQVLYAGDQATGAPAVTVGQYAASIEEKYGVYKGGMIAKLAQNLASSGVHYTAAESIYNRMGQPGEATVGAGFQWLDLARQFGGGQGNEALNLLQAASTHSPYAAGLIAQMAEPMMRTGNMSALTDLSNLGLSNQQYYMGNRMMQGDMNAWSNYARQSGNMAWQFADTSGRSIATRDMAGFMKMGIGQAQLGNQAAIDWFGNIGGGSPLAQSWPLEYQISEFFRSNNVSTDQEAISAWKGGSFGRTQLHNARMAGYSLAGIGIQLQGLQAQRQFLWGNDDGGSWSTPAQGSMWWYQDQMQAMQHKSTMTGFKMQAKRMDLTQQFAEQQEGISLSRMTTGHEYQKWMQGFDYAGMQMQQQWAREDWGYQDTMRGLSFGWQMEDLDEGIRYASGRDRKKLVRQKERATLSHNLEEQQTETSRERQETMWEREEERFNKQTEYSQKLMDLDTEQFELSKAQREEFYKLDREELARNKDEYQKQHELQMKMQQKEREYQAKQLELQEASLGVQAAAAIESQKYALEMETVTTSMSDISESAKTMIENDPSIVLGAMKDLSTEQAKLDAEDIKAQQEMTRELNKTPQNLPVNMDNMYASMQKVDTTMLKYSVTMYLNMSKVKSDIPREIGLFLDKINKVSPTKIQALMDVLDELSGGTP